MANKQIIRLLNKYTLYNIDICYKKTFYLTSRVFFTSPSSNLADKLAPLLDPPIRRAGRRGKIWYNNTMLHKLYKILIILGIVAVFAAIPVFWFSYSAPKDLEVDFLDVGQGDSILIKTPFGQNILIDGGADNTVITRLGENLPFWDRTIDLMVLSHPHDDHVNGLNDVIKRYDVKKIVYTGVIHSSPGFLNWLELIRDYNIPLIIIDRPQVINFGEDCYLDILYPRDSLLGKEVNNLNNSSIVAKLVYGESSFLFTGDAEAEVEKELLKTTPAFAKASADKPNPSLPSRQAGLDKEGKYIETPLGLPLVRGKNIGLDANVLKAGHHGSDTSSGKDFLEAVNPEAVVIQVGADNKFGHPSRRIIKRFERLGSRIFRNDLDGTIKIFSDGKKINIGG